MYRTWYLLDPFGWWILPWCIVTYLHVDLSLHITFFYCSTLQSLYFLTKRNRCFIIRSIKSSFLDGDRDGIFICFWSLSWIVHSDTSPSRSGWEFLNSAALSRGFLRNSLLIRWSVALEVSLGLPGIGLCCGRVASRCRLELLNGR